MRNLEKILITLSLFSTTLISAQSKKTDNIFFASEAEKIWYNPITSFSSINFAVVKFSDKNIGINLSFITKKGNKYIAVRPDSILLISDAKSLVLDNTFFDTTYLRANGSIFLSTIQTLNQEKIAFLQSNPIKNLVIKVNDKPHILNISKKSQRMIKELVYTTTGL